MPTVATRCSVRVLGDGKGDAGAMDVWVDFEPASNSSQVSWTVGVGSERPSRVCERVPSRVADHPISFCAVDYLPKANSPKGAMRNQLQLLSTDDALTMQVFTDRTHIEAFFVRFPPSPHILLH